MKRYDIAQICINGHIINDLAKEIPSHNKEFCEKCGKETITKCPSCTAEIQGRYNNGRQFCRPLDIPPAFCPSCGKPYPWTEAKMKAFREMVDELDEISPEEREKLKFSLNDIVSETPKTEVAGLKFKKILKKLGKDSYEGVRRILVDIAGETIKKNLFGS